MVTKRTEERENKAKAETSHDKECEKRKHEASSKLGHKGGEKRKEQLGHEGYVELRKKRAEQLGKEEE